jgi:hypothetical protein
MTIRKAERGTEPLRGLIALAGPSNSGKTFSALRIAAGLVETLGGKIALLDTELRGNLYHHKFTYDHYVMEPPFSPAEWAKAFAQLDSQYTVVISDNFSDEYEGPGGIAEMASLSPLRNDIAKWAQPKAEHKQLMSKIRLLKSQHIFLLRASDKIEIFQDRDEEGKPIGKQIVRPLGWQPHAEKNFKYDITLGWMLPPESNGHADLWKTIDGFSFKDGEQLSEDHGRAIAAWIKGTPAAQEGEMGSLVEIKREDGTVVCQSSHYPVAKDAYVALRKAAKDVNRLAHVNRDALTYLRTYATPAAQASFDRDLELAGQAA